MDALKFWPDNTLVAKYFAKKYNGDVASATPKQIGRVPDVSINHKAGRNNFATRIVYMIFFFQKLLVLWREVSRDHM